MKRSTAVGLGLAGAMTVGIGACTAYTFHKSDVVHGELTEAGYDGVAGGIQSVQSPNIGAFFGEHYVDYIDCDVEWGFQVTHDVAGEIALKLTGYDSPEFITPNEVEQYC